MIMKNKKMLKCLSMGMLTLSLMVGQVVNIHAQDIENLEDAVIENTDQQQDLENEVANELNVNDEENTLVTNGNEDGSSLNILPEENTEILNSEEESMVHVVYYDVISGSVVKYLTIAQNDWNKILNELMPVGYVYGSDSGFGVVGNYSYVPIMKKEYVADEVFTIEVKYINSVSNEMISECKIETRHTVYLNEFSGRGKTVLNCMPEGYYTTETYWKIEDGVATVQVQQENVTEELFDITFIDVDTDKTFVYDRLSFNDYDLNEDGKLVMSEIEKLIPKGYMFLDIPLYDENFDFGEWEKPHYIVKDPNYVEPEQPETPVDPDDSNPDVDEPDSKPEIDEPKNENLSSTTSKTEKNDEKVQTSTSNNHMIFSGLFVSSLLSIAILTLLKYRKLSNKI